ncbi:MULTISPECIES: TetR/AcrR family transcriptional regulator [Pseudomonas]|uniref:Transcriptional regulator, TetR family n=1 Tax=Pseudomonas delhiensis TaxID=366289 RepID=A0A239FTA2_9PSED|nr:MULTISPECIES: TetR/AcrR family transcriptional regulator [Pseudomonas]KES25139.1 TetR family transcriptional regulator [Pseudomonas sp. AAC]KRV67233.1 TetR family transcriptional regulator [Pseudomonas citronellolis]KRW76388.1 TetR family transcriptional regulator [Pseudomonas citronellolis]MBH3436567.1 TetR/AcrR family transcriptional regulator [Pseudomonas citronellolis]MCP1640873.1 AcrR family transcriptional regulator [Pseudomonas citronellolis]
MGRASRKDDILQAALACFSESGVDATTIEMIRDRSGASIGSLYHHFGNRERIIGALYLEGIGQYAALLDAGLREGMGAEATVKLFVTCYIDWVVAHPDWARFILHNRGRVEAGEMGEQLREANRQQGRRIAELLAVHRQAGAFREMPFELFNSVVIGPTHDYVRNWLAGRTRVELADCRDLLAQIAWESVRA